MIMLACEPLPVTVTPLPEKFKDVVLSTTATLSNLVVINATVGLGIKLFVVAEKVMVTGCSVTGIITPGSGSVSTPGSVPGLTSGGAVSGGPVGVSGVGICPVLPGPGGSSAGFLVGGPLVAICDPKTVFTWKSKTIQVHRIIGLVST